MNNFVERPEVIERIKDKDYDNDILNKWCHWAISKYDTEVIDKILNEPSFNVNDKYVGVAQLNKLVFYNDLERFKIFSKLIVIPPSKPFGEPGVYGIMKSVCWENKIDFLLEIIDLPQLDFTINSSIIVHHTYKNGHYEILSLLLSQREELRNDKELFNKYSSFLRASKINGIVKRIYSTK